MGPGLDTSVEAAGRSACATETAMPIKTYRPVTPTRRFQTVTSRADITKQRPEKSLVEKKQRTGGRNSTGRVTSRFIGGGAKQATG